VPVEILFVESDANLAVPPVIVCVFTNVFVLTVVNVAVSPIVFVEDKDCTFNVEIFTRF
jgi:hypothetical protein